MGYTSQQRELDHRSPDLHQRRRVGRVPRRAPALYPRLPRHTAAHGLVQTVPLGFEGGICAAAALATAAYRVHRVVVLHAQHQLAESRDVDPAQCDSIHVAVQCAVVGVIIVVGTPAAGGG